MKALAFALSLLATPVFAQETEHAGHAMPATPPAAAEDIVGNDPAPQSPADHAAERIFAADRMAKSRADMLEEMRFTTAMVTIDRLEYRANKGRNGYAWEAEAWFGGDIDRFTVASEGEGAVGRAPEQAELRAVWRHALDPWFNLELGVRHDVRPGRERSYAVIGIEGLAPYWFDVEGHLFVSNKGDAHIRAEASYDQRITQRLILQPSAEIDLAFQDVPELGIGSGIEKIEFGLRLRYEFVPEIAPYVGLHWEQKLAGSANMARARGDGASTVSAVLGIRAWF